MEDFRLREERSLPIDDGCVPLERHFGLWAVLEV